MKTDLNIDEIQTMQVVMNELIIKYKNRSNNDKYCVNCGGYSEEQYSKYILWHKYVFCSEWCTNDGEDDIRKMFRRFQRFQR